MPKIEEKSKAYHETAYVKLSPMGYRDIGEFKETCGYEIAGVWYPRVTKIVEIKAKPQLYRFYAEVGFAEGEEIKAKSASEGTLIHETFEQMLVGNSPPVDPSIGPAIAAAAEFIGKNDIKVDPEFVERRVVQYEHRYAGTIDALATIGGKFGILDIKTSLSIYRDYNLQTAAYMETLRGQFDNLETRWIMRIDQSKTCARCSATLRGKGGRNKVRDPYPRPYGWQRCADEKHEWGDMVGAVELKEFPEWHDDFQAFLGAKRLWEWENGHWLKKAGY
jgi:hypothetical protein